MPEESAAAIEKTDIRDLVAFKKIRSICSAIYSGPSPSCDFRRSICSRRVLCK